jgi:glycosyltransferase involved in cell wall biosynthesis
MQILLISWYFPPGNDVAALRTGAMAEYLEKAGHIVHVLTADREHSDSSLAVPISESRITRTRWFDVDHRRIMPRPGADAPATSSSPAAKKLGGKLRAGVSTFYYNMIHTPDRQVGWLPYAIAAGKQIIRSQGIDLIYASAPPFTGYLAARALGRQFSIPWVAEYRDGWSRYFYVPRPGWRQWVDEKMEDRTLADASGIVAVTQRWADYYRDRYLKPTTAVPNGFDARTLAPGEVKARPGEPVVIIYMGVLYEGLRDPAVLYQAIAQSGLTPDDIQVHYYGPSEDEVQPLAQKYGVADFVRVRPRVSFAQSVDLQRTSDVLLLLQSPVDARNVPAKLFEYFAARRPILGVGLDEGEPARLINERNAGFYRTDPAAIAAKLREWADEKRRTGAVAPPPAEAVSGLSRWEQFAKLEEFVTRVRKPELYHTPNIVVMRRQTRSAKGQPAILSVQRPCVVTTVDAEEEFDWLKPLSRESRTVHSMNEQYVLHRIFHRYDIEPMYFVTYPIVTQPEGSDFLAECLRAGKCQIGSQLHPWVTPPYDEVVNAYNSFAGNLPEALEYAKLKSLTDAVVERFGVRPTAYRAGRYGVGPNTVKALRAFGYRVDSSVVPEFSYHHDGGPTFFGRPTRPYWLDPEKRVLELPLTSTYVGRLTGGTPSWLKFANGLFEDDERHVVSRALMARSGLMERIRLTPEGTRVSDAKRLVRTLLKRGTRIFTLSYHTPSLVPGNTPYVRTPADRERFLDWFDEFYDFFLGELGGVPATVSEVYELARSSRADEITSAVSAALP